MDKTQYEVVLEGITVKRDRLLRRIERDQAKVEGLEADRAALERAWGLLMGEATPGAGNGVAPKTFAEAKSAKLGLMDHIRCIVSRAIEGQYITSEWVREELRTENPELYGTTDKSSIPGALSRLEDKGELVLVERGAGRRLSKFSLPSRGGEEDECEP